MSFRENLLKKIEINRLAAKVRKTIAPAASTVRIDTEPLRQLLSLSSFEHRRERDLDLYVKDQKGSEPLVLVLDNELPIYKTSVEDVVMRKSPYVKEMLSIRGIIKILKDSDVKISRKEASLDTLQADCLASLDLSYSAADIEAIAYDGAASLESKYPEGVIENLMLLAELTGFQPAPAPFKSAHHVVFGKPAQNESGKIVFGPAVIYDRVHGRLGLTQDAFSAADQQQVEIFQRLLEGKDTPSIQGAEVFKYIAKLVPAG